MNIGRIRECLDKITEARVIDIPFDGSTKSVDAEIFTFSEMLQPDDITI